MWRFVSKQPSLWKPGAACPRPSNEAAARGGAGRGALTGASKAARERGAWATPAWRAPAWKAGPAALAGHARGGGRQRGRTRQALKGQKPRDQGRERLAETDKGSPETVKGRDTVRERKMQEGGRRQELVRITETTYLDGWQGRTDSQTGLTPGEGRGCAREPEEAAGDDRDGWTCDRRR